VGDLESDSLKLTRNMGSGTGTFLIMEWPAPPSLAAGRLLGQPEEGN
jgi:hypothetical protein